MSPAAVDIGPASAPEAVLKPQQMPQEQPTSSAPRKDPAHEEYQYLDLISDILANGEHRPDR